MFRRSFDAVATSREGHRSLGLDRAGQRQRWDRRLPGIPESRRLSALDARLDAAMIFPVNKIPISTVIEGRGAREMVALVLRRRIGPIRALHPHNRRKQEVDMLISTKSGAAEKDRNGPVSAAEVMDRVVPHDQTWARSEPTTKAGTASCIKGEVRASDLQISDGAQVEGSVIAQNVTVCGRVKGTIRAVRVKLQNGGAVEGDIFHRTLSIDENSQFEGSSRRVENPTEIPSSIDAKVPQTKDIQSPTPTSNIDAD